MCGCRVGLWCLCGVPVLVYVWCACIRAVVWGGCVYVCGMCVVYVHVMCVCMSAVCVCLCARRSLCVCLFGVCLPLAVLGQDGFTGGDCCGV